ncbi:glycoside hydrolase family 32 protein [uncultured Draconibacterium sp.]|uniref:glycoside hydrolase family 32 protein n=1 Tax=uncultured Draconibacterium sp. TaxID=1573823 RepID=UPI003216AD1A
MKNSALILFLMLILLFGCTERKHQKAAASLHFSLNNSMLQNPVALIHIEDCYNLFFRYSVDGGLKQWGKARSKDLVHWNYNLVNVAFGNVGGQNIKTVVVDRNQTSAYSSESPALIAFSTSANQFGKLELLYSADNGLIWKQDEVNEILLADFYEPVQDVKVIWNDDLQKWIMLTLSGYEVRFYSSDNLINWEYLNRFGDDVYLKTGEWTSLDFFPMEVEGSHEIKWILFISADSGSPNEGSGVQYFVGDFDGFVYQASHNKPKWIDHGSDLYQAVVLSDYLSENKPPVLIGSIYNSIYEKFNINSDSLIEFSLARQLTLKEEFNDYYLIAVPVNTIDTIEKEKEKIAKTELTDGKQVGKKIQLPVRIDLNFSVNNRLYLGMAEAFGAKIKNSKGEELILGYQTERRYFYIAEPSIQKKFPDSWDGFNYAPYVTNDALMDMTLIIDKNSAELFAMNGLISLSRKFNFNGESAQLQLFGEKGTVSLQEGTITEFRK